MRLITLLNQLDQEGVLSKLYQAGAATLAVYAQREVYNHYIALLASPHYSDKRAEAARVTASTCGVSLRSVYRACRAMEQVI